MNLFVRAISFLAACCLASDAGAVESDLATQKIELEPPALNILYPLDRPRYGIANGIPLYIEADSKPVVLTTGVVSSSEAILSLPFKYKNKISTARSFKVRKRVVPAGSVGYETGAFVLEGVASVPVAGTDITIGVKSKTEYSVYCFFQTEDGLDFAVPACALNIRRGPFINSWAGLNNKSNLFIEIPQTGSSNKGTPEVVPVTSRVDHDFRLELKVDAWDEDGAVLHWWSEGKSVESYSVKPNADGAVLFELPSGTISLKRSPGDKTHTEVTFTPKPVDN